MSPSLKHRHHTLFCLLAGVLLTTPLLAADPLPFAPDFFQNKYWHDGKAEVSVFAATEKREGIVRPSEVKHIVVRETFSPARPVKTDDWQARGAYDVIKLNQILHIPTGTYDFYQMHSGFWRVDNGRLIKFSLAGIDSCGNAYKEGRIAGSRLSYIANTYWDGMDRVKFTRKLPEDVLFYDELPLKLRSLDWTKATSFSASVIPSVIGGKADRLIPAKAAFTVQEAPGGKAFQVTMRAGNDQDVFVFDKEFPHVLREWRRADGSALRLKSTVRIPYWKLNKPGDEKFLNPS
jgi:hypothetical protein